MLFSIVSYNLWSSYTGPVPGETMNPAAMIILIEYREIEGEERPVLIFFKHGLEEEKV